MKFEVPYFGIELSIDPGSVPGFSNESLRQMKIVPSDWKVDGEEYGPRILSGFSFENGVTFLANDNSLRFSESPMKGTLDKSSVPEIVRAYVNSVPNLLYESITFQIMGHFRIEENEDGDALFIVKSLGQSSWAKLGNLSDAELELEYDFGDCSCELSVKKMLFKEEDESSVGVVTLFAGFEHSIEGKSVEEQRTKINSMLDSVSTDLDRYQKMADQLVNGKESS